MQRDRRRAQCGSEMRKSCIYTHHAIRMREPRADVRQALICEYLAARQTLGYRLGVAALIRTNAWHKHRKSRRHCLLYQLAPLSNRPPLVPPRRAVQ